MHHYKEAYVESSQFISKDAEDIACNIPTCMCSSHLHKEEYSDSQLHKK